MDPGIRRRQHPHRRRRGRAFRNPSPECRQRRPVIGAVVNAATSLPGMAPGSIDTIYGVNLADAAVSLNGAPVTPALPRRDSDQFLRTPRKPPWPRNAHRRQRRGYRGLRARHRDRCRSRHLRHRPQGGDYLVIYCTGLGPTHSSGSFSVTSVVPAVYLGATALTPAFSGLAPGFTGLYQINVQLPDGLAPGTLPVIVTSGQQYSNTVPVTLQ